MSSAFTGAGGTTPRSTPYGGSIPDTGWRRVACHAAFGAGGFVRIRRIDNLCFMELDTQPAFAAQVNAPAAIVTLPVGFRATEQVNALTSVGSWGVAQGSVSRAVIVSDASTLSAVSTNIAIAATLFLTQCVWMTSDAWPVDLPGTAG